MKEDDELRGNSIVIYVLISFLVLSGCSNQTNSSVTVSSSSADWKYRFVVWNDDSYIILDEVIDPEDIENEIGQITKYSDTEATYGNGFSNRFPVGTKLFKMNGIETSEFIAIQTELGSYVKADNNGEYGGIRNKPSE